MKKVLSILLVIAMAATLFAGCNGSADPTATPDATPTPSATTQPSATPDATPTPSEPAVNQTPALDKVIEFNVYQNDSHESGYWAPATQDILMENYKLKVGENVKSVSEDDIYTEAGRTDYAAAIARLFETPLKAPDLFATLLSPDTGVDAVFKELGVEGYLFDFNPYMGEGKVIDNYVSWLWEGNEELWNAHREALLASDGGLYALPKRNGLVVNQALLYNRETLKLMGEGWDTWWTADKLPTEWDDFVDYLKQAKSVRSADVDEDKGHEYAPFVNRGATLDTILPFIAASYGLEWNVGYDWTVKNGEPLWTYAWDEYKLILDEVLTWVNEGLVPHDLGDGKGGWYAGAGKVLAGYKGVYDYDDDRDDDQKKLSERLGKNALALWINPGDGFGPAANNSSKDTISYKLSTVIPAQDGYTASLKSLTYLDTKYTCITTRQAERYGDELALRLMSYMNTTMSDEGYVAYSHGREGIPFADSRALAGNYLWVENHHDQYGNNVGRKIIWTVQEDWRFERTEEVYGYSIDNFYSQLDTMEGYGEENYEKYKYANAYYFKVPNGYGNWFGGEFTNVKDKNTDNVNIMFWNGRGNYYNGMSWWKDPTDYKMKLTIYWDTESFSHDYDNWLNMTAAAEADGTMIYNGLFANPVDVLGKKDGTAMENKISQLKVLAETFTLNALASGATEVSGWDTYIRSIKDAGYMDVYNYYKTVGTISYQSQYNEAIKSSTWMHANNSKLN